MEPIQDSHHLPLDSFLSLIAQGTGRASSDFRLSILMRLPRNTHVSVWSLMVILCSLLWRLSYCSPHSHLGLVAFPDASVPLLASWELSSSYQDLLSSVLLFPCSSSWEIGLLGFGSHKLSWGSQGANKEIDPHITFNPPF